jgi:hypothetical protein
MPHCFSNIPPLELGLRENQRRARLSLIFPMAMLLLLLLQNLFAGFSSEEICGSETYYQFLRCQLGHCRDVLDYYSSGK